LGIGPHSSCFWSAIQCSTVAEIKASVIQGFGVGPSSYIITAGDLHPITPGNRLFKFADDTYLVIPEANTNTRTLEIRHIRTWAAANNLALNCSKSKEMISGHAVSAASQLARSRHVWTLSVSLLCEFLASLSTIS